MGSTQDPEHNAPESPAVAFFDLDRTLLPAHTSLLYLRLLWREGRVGLFSLLHAAFLLTLYFFNRVDLAAVVARVLSRVAGDDDAAGWERGQRCVQQLVLPRISAGARAALEAHRRLGHAVCILSASPMYVVVPLAKALGVDGLGTALAVAQGRLTGGVDGPLLYGPNKVGAAQRYAQQRGVLLDACHFYTDSASDLPLMDRVGHPVAINPDPMLHRVARTRGWPVHRWR